MKRFSFVAKILPMVFENAWWEAFITFWDDIAHAVAGTFWPVEDRSLDYPDAADTHVDFGGGDE